jgi:hypothetical protein
MKAYQWCLPRDRVPLARPRCCTHHTIPILEARPIPLRLTVITEISTTRIVVQTTPAILAALLRPPPTHSRPTYRHRIQHAHDLPICSHRVPTASLRMQRKLRQPGKMILHIAPILAPHTPGCLAGQLGLLRIHMLPTRPKCPLPASPSPGSVQLQW